ncbi:hypothetical protein [Bacillus haynesii]|uniref:hypothetical protein n=1 Tax=Bacillus haynesii TaxID=1925021 RepID=UPI00228199BA|nr:hypothetical protein [Bacillus haynesii]MCY9450853.1 hypothetical protein [Bacillus haynesii]
MFLFPTFSSTRPQCGWLSYVTGMLMGEVFELRWSDIDLNKGGFNNSTTSVQGENEGSV